MKNMNLCLNIGTKNQAKTHAVRSVFEAYRASLFTALGLSSVGEIKYIEKDVSSGVRPYPQDFPETMLGARTRSENALSSAFPESTVLNIGLGIESGFITFQFPEELSGISNGIFNFDVCCIRTTKLTVYGFSQGIEYPYGPANRILKNNEDFDEVMKQHFAKFGFSVPPSKLGYLGILTDSRYPRQDVCTIAVEHAVLRFIHNKDYYG